jgi:hypothetical protein
MHVRTVQSFQVNTLHTVVSFPLHTNVSFPKVPKGTPPGGFTSSPRVPIRIRHVVRPEPLRPPAHQDTPSPGYRVGGIPHVHHPPDQIRQGPLPPEGGSLDSKTYIFPPLKPWWGAFDRGGASTPPLPPASSRSNLNVTPRPAPRPRHGQPATANASPRPPLHEVRFDNTVGADGGHSGADPAELGTTSEHFSPSPSTRGPVRQHWAAPPPAKPLRARVTRCGHPRIGTRPTNHGPRANAGA